MKELSTRLQNLLETSIEDYIKSAVPISSGAIVKKLSSKLSPATIRNELKTLEEMGYLKQLHTSGGRVPTTQGYRLYVNKVLSNLNIAPGELSLAAEKITERVTDLPAIIDEICKELSAKFNLPIIVKQQFENLTIIDIKVVALVDKTTMVLIKTTAGSLNQILQTEAPFTERQCDDAAAALATRFVGLSLKEMVEGLPKHNLIINKSLKYFDLLCTNLAKKLEYYISGSISRRNVTKLLTIPDYSNIEIVKRVGEAFEDDETFTQVLAQNDTTVLIGGELDQMSGLENSSIIKFNYKIENESIASVGILGPERMDYKALIGALYSLTTAAVENRKLAAGKSPPSIADVPSDIKKEKEEI